MVNSKPESLTRTSNSQYETVFINSIFNLIKLKQKIQSNIQVTILHLFVSASLCSMKYLLTPFTPYSFSLITVGFRL